jgi:DNA-binding CsgD family transcriptional regulator/PAS domain-containing protein
MRAGSAVVQIHDETQDRPSMVWQARDSRSTADSDLHDRVLNNPDNPRLHEQTLTDLPRAVFAELMLVGSDRRLFGRYPRLFADIRERLAQIELGHAFWISFPVSDARRFSLILHREAGDDRDLTEGEEAILRKLLPHIQQTARLWLSLEAAGARIGQLENAIDRIDLPLVVCDGQLRIEWSNAAAREFILQAQSLMAVAGRLQARDPAGQAILRRLVEAVASGTVESQVGVIAARDHRPVHVRATRSPVTPLSTSGDRIGLFLSQPDFQICLNPADLSAVFLLTPAEARLAVALARGASLASYSTSRGISVGTARNQLKQVLAKTSSRSQSELVRTLCNSAASRAR